MTPGNKLVAGILTNVAQKRFTSLLGRFATFDAAGRLAVRTMDCPSFCNLPAKAILLRLARCEPNRGVLRSVGDHPRNSEEP